MISYDSDNTKQLKVLYVGDLSSGSTASQRLRILQEIGCSVIAIDSTPPSDSSLIVRLANRLATHLYRAGFDSVRLPDLHRLNRRLLESLDQTPIDLVWIDKGTRIEQATLKAAKARVHRIKVVGYSLDNMLERHNQSRQFVESLPLYDLFVTTKSFAVHQLSTMGCKQVLFVDNAFDTKTHRPVPISSNFEPLQQRVGFVGTWEQERERSITRLASAGIPVTVFGNGWPRRLANHPNLDVRNIPVYGEQYAEALSAFAVNLCFLRRNNHDLQTTRTVEIPACGGFMLAERTDEHLRMFREGTEAEFFSDDAELIHKASFFLKHPDLRRQISAAGRRRCLDSDYSYESQLRAVLAQLGITGSKT